ncbi:Arc family DNA-binding protein [Comamonas avium]|uniref:Arc family DNA-binding protein n=1 Tax=Comamonas avium TaxID=2762231 RepID=A0ABR8SFA1_9BURK|nr:Arc family DNA-binding protein [Comamonas avium]MBD7962153.1 Arc family DNA-binding protein [Comamonas avium]
MSREDPQMKIRLPADLKDQIEIASKSSGRSMNAEIVARLELSLDPNNNSAALKQRILEMEGDAALVALQASQAKSDLLATQLLVIQIAKMCPPGVIPKGSTTSQLLQRILDKEGDLIQESLHGMIESLLSFEEAIEKRIDSGQLKVVSNSEGPTKFTAVIDHLKKLTTSTNELAAIVEKDTKSKTSRDQ